MPTREQIMAMQQQLARDAEKAGMSVPEFVEHLKKQAQEQQARMQAAMQQQQQQQGEHQHGAGQPQPIVPGPPNPVAIALAKFLRAQNLKPRTCILNGERKDMFKGMA
jgi:translocation protein SEC62